MTSSLDPFLFLKQQIKIKINHFIQQNNKLKGGGETKRHVGTFTGSLLEAVTCTYLGTCRGCTYLCTY